MLQTHKRILLRMFYTDFSIPNLHNEGVVSVKRKPILKQLNFILSQSISMIRHTADQPTTP